MERSSQKGRVIASMSVANPRGDRRAALESSTRRAEMKRFPKLFSRRTALAIFVGCGFAYLAAFFFLSRTAFRFESFPDYYYFVEPTSTADCVRDGNYRRFFLPIILFEEYVNEHWFETGHRPGNCPCFDLFKRVPESVADRRAGIAAVR
jgi:hypothetical protein